MANLSSAERSRSRRLRKLLALSPLYSSSCVVSKGCASVENTYARSCTKLSWSNSKYKYLHVSDRKKDGMLFINSRVVTSFTAAYPHSVRVCCSSDSRNICPARSQLASPVVRYCK